MIWNIITDTITDTLKLLPFLFFTYLVMEYIEQKAGKRTEELVQKAGKFGPVIGSLLGVIPQCGFSAASSGLYAGRIITLGTLISIFLSTSDEMLPILISEQISFLIIIKILLIKIIIGMAAGLCIDLAARQKKRRKAKAKAKANAEPEPESGHLRIEELCSHQNCRCKEGNLLKSALSHTFQIALFIAVISFALNFVMEAAGGEKLFVILSGRKMIGPVLAGIIGLIPNCASSVALTKLYLEGVLNAGSMMAGLLAGAGAGPLVLFKVNKGIKENLQIMALLYVTGVLSGIMIEVLHFSL